MSKTSKNTGQKDWPDWLVIASAIAGVLALMGLWACIIHPFVPIPHNSDIYTRDDWQAFADMYGAVAGTFFSALAFALLIYASWMQRRELAMQREELTRTADAQEAAEAALTAQVETTKQAAQLNALTALLEYAERNSDRTSPDSRARREAEEAIDAALERLLKTFKDVQ